MGLVHNARQLYVEQGLVAALERQPKSRHRPRKLDGAQEARLIALACGPAPEGRARWTLRLLASQLVKLEIFDSNCVSVRFRCHHFNSGFGSTPISFSASANRASKSIFSCQVNDSGAFKSGD